MTYLYSLRHYGIIFFIFLQTAYAENRVHSDAASVSARSAALGTVKEKLREIIQCSQSKGGAFTKDLENWIKLLENDVCKNIPEKFASGIVVEMAKESGWSLEQKLEFKKLIGECPRIQLNLSSWNVPPLKISPDYSDKRSDQDVSWILDLSSASAGNDEDEYVFEKKKGLIRAPLQTDGKEYIPSFRYVLKYSPLKKEYYFYLSDEKGNLEPVQFNSMLSGYPLGAPINSRFRLRKNDSSYFGTGHIHLSDLKVELDVGRSFTDVQMEWLYKEGNLDPKWHRVESILRKKKEVGRTDSDVLIPTNELPFDVSTFEQDFGLGLAVGDKPLSYSWFDPSESESLGVDETNLKAFSQLKNKGKLELNRYRVIPLNEICLGEKSRTPSYLLGTQIVSESGLGFKVKNETVPRRGWYLESVNGGIVRLEEDPNSEKGELSHTKKHAALLPVLGRKK